MLQTQENGIDVLLHFDDGQKFDVTQAEQQKALILQTLRSQLTASRSVAEYAHQASGFRGVEAAA